MSIKLPSALSKKKPNMKIKCPLPIPLDSAGENKLPYTLFTGYFKYGSVIINQKDYAKMLWENGFFGDGSLSNSGLRYNPKVENMTDHQVLRANEWAWKMRKLKIGNKLHEGQSTIPMLSEVLHLCLEEALFLSYALGTLILTNESGSEMDIDDMWTAFCEIDPFFPVNYAVYHHFRCKGWVVKPGLKFGARWTLYPVGPPFQHSQYLVWIQCLWEDNLDEDETLSSRSSDITDIAALDRLSIHVGKCFLVCQILRPRSLTGEDLKYIQCLQSLTIGEMVVQRWTPVADNLSVDEPQTSKGKKRPNVSE